MADWLGVPDNDPRVQWGYGQERGALGELALAVAAGVRRPSRMDTLQSLLQADDREVLLGWLRQQAMA
mgnify:CR=1 FL=1